MSRALPTSTVYCCGVLAIEELLAFVMTHPDLTDVFNLVSGVPSSLNICIVTPDLLGPVRNGGIGTANTFLAHELAAAGHKVSILFSQCGTTATISGPWLADYHQRGIEVEVAEEWAAKRARVTGFPNHAPLVMAHTVHDWLAAHTFDAVILMEWQGHGFYALQAKRGGLRFQKTAFITQIHSPSLWHAIHNADFPTDPMQSLTYVMERKSVELADAVISPSAYMLDWVRQHGFNPPVLSFVQPNLLEMGGGTKQQPDQVIPVEELVFFGRLEYRKGLVQFCDALDRLAGLGTAPQGVTFLGKFSRMGHEHSGLYIARRAKKWNFPVKIVARLGQVEALGYLSAPGRLAVMPSVADNSPYTVYECLVAGIPFLARDVGGVGELIAARDRAACLFNDNPNVLARSLAKVLAEGAKRPRLAFTLEENREAWHTGLPALMHQIRQSGATQNGAKRAAKPWVSICLTHYNRPKLLRQAVDSLLEQDYPNLEVILVDDGSTSKAAARMLQTLESEFAHRGWKILRLQNGYLGKARNTATREARGDYLLFMDDDNVARPNMVSRFVQAAVSSGADLVTTVFEVFSGNKAPNAKTRIVERFLPVGDIVSFSVVTNAIGDANSLIRRDLFERLGGFSEDYGLGHEDFELYLRAVLCGASVNVVPDPLFWYRRNGESMLSATHAAANRMRSFRPFIESLSAPLVELAVVAHGLAAERIPAQVSAVKEFDGLLPVDQQRLATGDPDAPETVTAVANVLRKMGQEPIADALLHELVQPMHGKSDDASVWTLSAAVILAARRSDVDQLRKLFVASGKSTTAKDTLASACFDALTAIEGQAVSSTGVVEMLVGRLLRLKPDNLEARLTVMSHLLGTECSSSCVENILIALELADKKYLDTRPDVEAAVELKQFSCGLKHYYAHGREEGVPWPMSREFISIWPRFSEVVAENELDHLPEEKKRLLSLAYQVFLE